MKAQKLPSGNWRVLAYAGRDSQGKEIRKSFTGPDKKKVLRDAAAFVDEHRTIKDTSCSFGASAEDFIKLRTSVLSPATIRGYTNVSKQIKERSYWFWNTRIYSIGTDEVQRLVDQLSIGGLGPKTIKNYMGFVSAVLRSKSIRMPIVNMPQRIRPDLHIPDASVVKQTLSAAEDNRELWICIMLAATGPLRRGEIAALSVDDVDFDRNVIHVCHDMVMGPDKEWHIKPPKTVTSDRFLVMPEELILAIRKQGYVTSWTPKQIYNKHKWLLHKNGIPHYRFHDLRHFCVSHLKAMGIPDVYIAQRTGHADYATLRNVYTHTLQDQQKAVNDRILKEMDAFIA